MSSYDDDLNSLEDWLRRLKVEYDIFFNGHRKKPPEDLRLRLEKLSKKLAESGGMSIAQRFRYNTLIGRYYVYRDLWRRTLSEKESGLEPREPPQKGGARPAAPTAEAPEKEFRISVKSPESDQEEIRSLYEAVNRLRGSRAAAAPKMPFSQFADYIASQTQKIKQKSGCTSVQFTLSVEGDSVKFTAKPENKP